MFSLGVVNLEALCEGAREYEQFSSFRPDNMGIFVQRIILFDRHGESHFLGRIV